MDKSIELLNDIFSSKDDYIVVGCSGGPDSMCLLDILHREGFKIICAHVNHNIREESDDELEFLKGYCEEKKIIFETLILPKNEIHDESYYRKKRYEFYKTTGDKYGTKYIMTAHHGDDLIETILMRISRGSHLRGYMGFPKYYDERGYKIIKPLIFYTKDDILKYNESHSIPFVFDHTNDEEIYTRNRYRHNVLTFLKKETEDVHLKYLKFSEELESANEFIENFTAHTMRENFDGSKIDLNLYLKLDKYIQKKELELIFKEIYKDDIYKIKTAHLTDILNLLMKGQNFSLDLPGNIVIKREYEILNFIYEENTTESYNIKVEDDTELSNGDMIKIVPNSSDSSNYTTRLNLKDIKLPLYIRNRRVGDRIEVKNMRGSKKVKDIFIDEKIPASTRDTYPLLVDSEDKVLWIPGIKKSKFDNQKDEKCDIILEYIKKGNFNEKK